MNDQNSYIGSGCIFTRYYQSLAIGKGNPLQAESYAQGRNWHSTPGVLTALKALVDPLSVGDTLAATRAVSTDYAEYVRKATILGRLEGKKRVPFMTRMLTVSAGTSAGWFGEGTPIPVSRMALNDLGVQLAMRRSAELALSRWNWCAAVIRLPKHSLPATRGPASSNRRMRNSSIPTRQASPT